MRSSTVGFEIEVVVAQQRFGLVARPRRAPHQEDRDAGQQRSRARSQRPSPSRRAAAVRSAVVVRSANSRSSSVRMAADDIIDALHRIGGPGLAQHRDAAGHVVALDEIDGLGKFLEPRLDRRAQLPAVLDLNRIVAGQFASASRRQDGWWRRRPRARSESAVRKSADNRARRFRRDGFPAAGSKSGFRPRRCGPPMPLSSRA